MRDLWDIKGVLRKARENAETQRSLWMLPYSTLMMILMILFLALYGYSYVESLEYEEALAEMASEQADQRVVREVKLAREVEDFIKDLHMEDTASVSVTAHAIKIQFQSPVIFDSGSAELKADIMPLLVKIYSHLREMDNEVVVEGHTDDVPISTPQFASNWELSASRAFSVIYFFLVRGIEPDRLMAHGYGEFKPAFPNDSDFGRAMNRRLQITIIRGGDS